MANREFLQAALMGNLPNVQRLLSSGTDIQANSNMNDTPLHLAALNGHVKIVEYLLSKGALKNAKNANNETPLHRAASRGKVEALQVLVNADADLLAKNKFGNTPLHLAASEGHLHIVNRIIECESNRAGLRTFLSMSARNDNNETPLHRAALKGQTDVVAALLNYDADIQARNKGGNTPLHLAAANGKGDVVKIITRLVKHGDYLNATNNIQQTPLDRAAIGGHQEIVELLRNAGAQVDAKHKEDYMPLHAATEQGDSRASTSQTSPSDRTANRDLLQAAYKGNHLEVQRCLESGADIQANSSMNDTPLHLAALNGHVKIAEYLLNKGALQNAKNANNETPLHRAASRGKVEALQVLVKADADINARNNRGNTPLHLAAANGKGDTVNMLTSFVKHGDNLNAMNHGGYSEIIQILIKVGAQVDPKQKDDYTPLHLATIQGESNLSTIKLLLCANADMYNINNSGNTGAHHAAFTGNFNILKLLIEHNFYVNYKNSKGNTLLHLAAREGHFMIVSLLIDHKCQLDTYNHNGDSPVSLAARLGCTNIVEMLIRAGASPTNPKDGKTILHAAAIGNRLQTCQVILTNFKDKIFLPSKWKGMTAEDCANITGNVNLAWWLRKQSEISMAASPYDSSRRVCREGYEKSGSNIIKRASVKSKRSADWLVKSIEDGEIEMHYMDEVGNTMLHVAVTNNNNQTVEKLLELGALKIARNYKNQAPLEVTPKSVDSRMASYLYAVLLNIISQTIRLDILDEATSNSVSGVSNMDIDEERMITKPDKQTQKLKLEAVRIVSKIMTLGISLDPTGSYGVHLLPLAITTNNKTLLPILLAAGVPLTTTVSGMGIVELAWLTPDQSTWVRMVVTRAVIHRLQAELETIEKSENFKSFAGTHWNILVGCIGELVNTLSGEKPSEARFKYPKTVALTELFVMACKVGATLTAWYIWSAGGNLYERFSGLTALEAAVSENQFYTATRLVLDMKANPFVMGTNGFALIDEFPDKQLLKLMLGQDYRCLDKLMVKAKDKCDIRELQQIIILLMVLYLQYISREATNKWRSYFATIMRAYSRMPEETDKWMCTLKKFLETKGVDSHTFSQISEMKDETDRKQKEIGLKETGNKYNLDETEDNFYNLFCILEYNFSRFNARDHAFPDLNILLKKAFRICCEDYSPLFLHLLVTIAKVNVDMILNRACQTRSLHHAARLDNLSAISYLLDRGASSTFEDFSGIMPVYYAFMYGHKNSGYYLLDHIKKARSSTEPTGLESNIEKRATFFWTAHEKYLEYYDMKPGGKAQSRYPPIQNYDQLQRLCLDSLKNKWERYGIRATVDKFTVTYEEEAHEVKTAVESFLDSFKAIIASKNRIFEGDLQFVGSSVDNVRMFCPDEYDCNLCLKNISAHPGGGLNCELLEFDAIEAKLQDHDKYLKVQPLNKELEGLIEESKFLSDFYETAIETLNEMNYTDLKLKWLLPGVKRTQVGIAFTLLWLGKQYHMLFVDVDLVPTIKAPWPENLQKPKCAIPDKDLTEVYVNSIGKGEWRFSFGKAETILMQDLSNEKREVYLACKMILSAFKTENWFPSNLKRRFKYWDCQLFSLSSKGGFALKNSFFRELEEVPDAHEWRSRNLLKRMRSIFKRMCEEWANPPSLGAQRIRAYFGGDAEKSSIYLIAPEVLKFVNSLDDSIIDK